MLYMNFHTQNQEISTVRGFYYFFLIFVTYQCSKKVKLTINFHAFPSVNFLKIVLFFNSCSTYLQTVFILLKFVRANCLY